MWVWQLGSISSTFYARFFADIAFFCQQNRKPKCNREKLGKALLFEKCVRKMLMKLTPVNVSTFGYCVLPLLSALENSFNNSAKIVYESWTKNKKMVREI